MTDMIITRYADLTGRGFDRHPVDDETVDRSFWDAARQLIERAVPQPSDFLRNTSPHPVWTLRQVRVGDTWYWCFSVQGRGDGFGVAGTCRFGFLPAGVPAQEAWRRGREEVAAHDPTAPASRPVAEGIEEVIVGLAREHRVIRLPGDPADAAAVIERVLGVVPPDLAADRVWATCLLQDHDLRKSRVVAGGMPAAFRADDAKLYARIEHYLPSPEPSAASLAAGYDPIRARGIDYLVRKAAAAGGYDWSARPAPRTMEALIDAVAADANELSVETIAASLGDRRTRDQLLKDETLLYAWVDDRPAEALHDVRTPPPDRLTQKIFNRLIDNQRNTAANLLDLPTADRAPSDEWVAAVRGQCMQHLGRKSKYSDFLGELVTHGPLRDPRDFHAARALWLGLDSQIGDDRYATTAIGYELRRTGVITEPVRTAVSWLAAPARALADSDVASVRLSGDVAGELVGLAITRGRDSAQDVDRLVRAIAETSMPTDSDGAADGWCQGILRLDRYGITTLFNAAQNAVDAVLEARFPAAARVVTPPPAPAVASPRLEVDLPVEERSRPQPTVPYEPGGWRATPSAPAAEPEPVVPSKSWARRHEGLLAYVGLGGLVLVVGIVVVMALISMLRPDDPGLLQAGQPTTQAPASVPPSQSVAPQTKAPPVAPLKIPEGVHAITYEVPPEFVDNAAANINGYFNGCVAAHERVTAMDIVWLGPAQQPNAVETLKARLVAGGLPQPAVHNRPAARENVVRVTCRLD